MQSDLAARKKLPSKNGSSEVFQLLLQTGFPKKTIDGFYIIKREKSGVQDHKNLNEFEDTIIWDIKTQSSNTQSMPSNTPTNDVKISVEADVICLFFQNKHRSSHPKQFGKCFILQNWISIIIQLEVGGTTLGREDSGTIHCFAYQLYVFKWTTSHWVYIDFNKRSTHQQNTSGISI